MVIFGSKPEGNCLLLHWANQSLRLTTMCQTFHLDLWSRPLTLTSIFDLDPHLWPWPQSKVIGHMQWSPNTIFSIWHWPLTYNLTLGRPACTKNQGHRSKDSNRKGQTRHNQMDRRTVPSATSPCFGLFLSDPTLQCTNPNAFIDLTRQTWPGNKNMAKWPGKLFTTKH